MVYLMGMQSKELHKLCGRLREDRFLAVYVVQDILLSALSDGLLTLFS
jgi:transcription initiation factor TFIIE subunit alpha